MADKFKCGDVVQLKSGGPKMTVYGYSTSSTIKIVQCKWFAGAKAEASNFHEDMLTPYTEEK